MTLTASPFQLNSPPGAVLETFEEDDFAHNFPTPPPERQKSLLQNARSQFQRALPTAKEYVYQPTDPDLVRSWLAPYGIVLEGKDCCQFRLNRGGCEHSEHEEEKELEPAPKSPNPVNKRKTKHSESECHDGPLKGRQTQKSAKQQQDPQEIDDFVTRIMKQAEMTADVEGPPAKKPRGRPKGAKSKAKIRMDPIVEQVKVIAPVPKRPPQDRKGCVPYGIIAGLAIFNAKRPIPSKEIYRFAKHYFPGCVVGTYWKNSIRHILCTQDYFVKDRPDIGTAYSFHWDMVPEKMYRFWASVEDFRKGYPDERTYGMNDHTHWPLLVKGELGLLDVEVPVDLRDYPKNIRVKPEPIDVDSYETAQPSQESASVSDEVEIMKTVRIKHEPMDEQPCPAISEILNQPSKSSSSMVELSSPPSQTKRMPLRNKNTSSAHPSQDSLPSSSSHPPQPHSRPPTPRFPGHPPSYRSPPLGPPPFLPPPPYPGHHQPFYGSPPLGQHSPSFLPPHPHGMWPHPPFRMPGYPPGGHPYPYPPLRSSPPTNSAQNMHANGWYSGEAERISPKDIEEESRSILLDLLTNDPNKEIEQVEEETAQRNTWENHPQGEEAQPSVSSSPPPPAAEEPRPDSHSNIVVSTCRPQEVAAELLEDQCSQPEKKEKDIPWHLYDHDYCRRDDPLPYPPSRWLERRRE